MVTPQEGRLHGNEIIFSLIFGNLCYLLSYEMGRVINILHRKLIPILYILMYFASHSDHFAFAKSCKQTEIAHKQE